METTSQLMADESKEIFSRQNLPGMISAQKAASYCYAKGKQLAVILACLLIILPIVINLSIQFVNNEVISCILIVISLIDFIFGEIIKRQLNKAKLNGAGMQQYFDEFIFNLKNSSKKYLAPKKLSLEERLKLIRKFEDKDNSPYYDWYSNYSTLPYEQAVYNCQKENIRWDISIRKKYRVFQIILASLAVIVIAISAILQRMNVLSLIVIVFSIAPLFSYFYSGFQKLHKDIASQQKLYDTISSIEGKLKSKKKIWDEIEELQVEIFDYRKKAYLIPNWFYKLFRKNMQTEEDRLAKEISKVDNKNS